MFKQLLDEFSFDNRNNQGFGNCYQPQPYTLADKTHLAPDYCGYYGTSNPIDAFTRILL